MRYGIVSDIHGNLEALTKTLTFLEPRSACLIILGDVVGYGPDPVACLELLADRGAIFVRGNHEEGFLTGDLSRFSADAKTALVWTSQKLSPEWRKEITSWPASRELDEMLIFHGSPSDPLFGYIYSPVHAKNAFPFLESAVTFHGHTHFPVAYRQKGEHGKLEVVPPDFQGTMRVAMEEEYRYLINVGSVGQPRDGIPSACAGIYDTDAKLFTLHRIPYPAEETKIKIEKAGLPSSLAKRLIYGA